ncbi:histidine kinase [Bradyrhizobium sp. CCGUVB1N3]|uniref:sensor histidine kinase n=1 Tax=Bradyrhizobium sp. CCGUVB1N3 TaxID=2949629 RepID=UPI0020B30FF4|nr:histidine kinase [Bradyrhizobium sp. CCGUVB1N3]MCP3469505.1 histidine kinase [Bradyrhizobium sp. CCGUVB1N3]
MCGLLCFGSPSYADEAAKHILILHSYNYTFPATSMASDGARGRLLERSPQKIELDAEYLDLARFAEPGHEALMAGFLRDRYAHRRPDVVMVIGGDALPFVIRHRDDFAPHVPVVFLGVSKPGYAVAGPPPDVTGHIVDLAANLNATIALAERLQPDASRLFIIAGSGLVDRRWQPIARTVVEARGGKLDTTYLFDLRYDEVIAKVTQIPSDAIVILLSMFRDGGGKALMPSEVAAQLIKSSSAPVYAPYPYPVRGFIGGFSESYEAMGRTAGDIALEILAGKDPASIPPRTSSEAAYRVDYQAMHRWGLSEDNLPPGSVVLFKEPGVWELYHRYIIGAGSLIVLQSVLIAALIVQRSRRWAAEQDNRSKESALRTSYEQLRYLAGRLIHAQDEERQRIARELHDDVGQRVASLSIGLSSLRRRLPDSPDTTRAELARLQRMTVDLAEDMRDLSHGLHQGVLEHAGLPEALRERCEEITRGSNTSIDLDVAEGCTEVRDDVKLCLYRVAQEALRNIAKHAHARTGRISVAREDGQIVMKIADDGEGFDANASGSQCGLGLLSMRERVRMLGGTFEIKSAPQAGTIATICIPAGGSH